MKVGRVISAGLVAGLVINIGEFLLNGVVLKEEWDAAMTALDLPVMSGGAIGVLIVWCFFVGIALVWLYAAIRARYGPGPKTAIRAGILAWLFMALYPFIWNSLVPIYPSNLMTIGVVWSFFELAIAAMVGGWLYKEDVAVVAS